MHARPDTSVKRLAGLLHRVVDVFRAARSDLGEHLAGRRVGGRVRLTGFRPGELAVDPRIGREGDGLGHSDVLLPRQDIAHT